MFHIIVKPRMFGLGIVSKETCSCLFNLVYLIVFLTKLLEMGCLALKEILSHLFNPFNLKILDLYLETWLWSPLICAEKALHGEVDVWDCAKTYTFTILFVFNVFVFILFYFLLLLLYYYFC